MDIKELQVKVQSMEKELQRLKDIEAVRKLQQVYGYYLNSWMNEELIDLFSGNEQTTVDFPQGTFLGKKGVVNAFGHMNKAMNPEFMHQLMQLQGVIDIAEDGRTAKARWWSFGAMAIPAYDLLEPTVNPQGVTHEFACGLYENEYIKEDGVWKIWKLKWVPLYSAAPASGWVKPERQTTRIPGAEEPETFPDWWQPDLPSKRINYAYPSGYILPFHFNHPVTGKKSTEDKRNARVKGLK